MRAGRVRRALDLDGAAGALAREIKDRHKQWCRARTTNHYESPRVEVAPFDEFVPAAPVGAPSEENPLAWLDDHLGGTGERVPF